jgi:hypothetical protein
MNKIEHKEFIKKLLAFLEEGFQNPINIINYLQSRDKCNKLKCKTKDCKALTKYFPDNKTESPWSLKLLGVIGLGGTPVHLIFMNEVVIDIW